MMSRPIHILYFAWLRERAGTGEEVLQLPDGVGTVGGLIAHLRQRGPGHDSAFDTPHLVRFAVNQDLAGVDTAIGPGDEIAFFPPVTGG